MACNKAIGSGNESTNTAVVAQIQNVAAENTKRRAIVTSSVASDGVDECDFILQSGNGNNGAGGSALEKLEMRKNTNNRHSNESGT